MVLNNARKSLLLCGIGLATALTLPAAASANEAQPANSDAAPADEGLEIIVVQARKVSENMQDVPVAITAFSGSDLEKQNFQQLQDLGNFTPSLNIAPGQSSAGAATIALRGQLQNDILATLDPSVGTYVDGVYWARAYGLNSSVLDVESVQVLKGPQGTLFGRNTTGGALLINTRNPELDAVSGQLSASYGRFNELELTGILNLPIVADRVALRIAASRSSRDGDMTNVAPATAATAFTGATYMVKGPFSGPFTGERYNGRDRWNARAKLLLRPTDTLELLFSGEYYDADDAAITRDLTYVANAFAGATRSNYNVGTGVSRVVGLANGFPDNATAISNGKRILQQLIADRLANPRTASINERPNLSTRTYTLNFTASLDVPWGQVKLITGLRDVKSSNVLDTDGTPYVLFSTELQQNFTQYSGEIQTTGKMFDDAVDFATGLFYFHEYGSDVYNSISTPLLNPNTSHNYGYIKNDSMGIYAQGTWHITEALGLTGGLRYSVDDKSLESRNNDYNRATGMIRCRLTPVAPFASAEIFDPVRCSASTKGSFSGWSYTLGVDYKLWEDTMLYAKTSKGFRSGGANYRAQSLAGLVNFAPERAYSHEIGLKTELLDRKIRFNVAAYITDVKDRQSSTIVAVPPIPPATVGSSTTVIGNSGSARFKGLEAELAIRPVRGLTLSASGSLVDPKHRRFSDLTGDRRQERFVGIAKKQFSLAADYSTDLSEDVKTSFHVGYAWRGKMATGDYNFPENPENAAIIAATTVPALGLLGARASVTWRNFELAVYGRNLTNERDYLQHLQVMALGFVTSVRQEPATYGISGTVRF